MALDLETLIRDLVWAAYIARVRQLGLAFHPDTRGNDYVAEGGGPAFTPTEAAEYERDVEAAFARDDEDPYEVAIAVWQKLF